MRDRLPVQPFLLLGEAPNPATEDRPDLWLLPDSSGTPHSANRLREFTGYSHREYRETFARDNLLHFAPPRAGNRRGFQFPIREAREGAARVLHELLPERRGVIVLGSRAARAFRWGWPGEPPTETVPKLRWGCATVEGVDRIVRAAVVPHPSGANRWWSDAENRARGRAFFAELLAEAASPGGRGA